MKIEAMIEKKLHELKTKILSTQIIQVAMREELANDIFEIEKLAIVSKSVAKQYAEFCVRCDREGLPLLELDDYIKQYCG